MSRFSYIMERHSAARSRVYHRNWGNIPNCSAALDITRVDYNGHITILNPSPRAVLPWHPNFDVNAIPGYVKNRLT